MKIVRCEHTHRDAWDRFVDRQGDGSFYHRYDWREINARCFGHESVYLAAFDGGAIAGVLPIVRLKSRLFGRIACSLPFVNYGGVLAEHASAEAALVGAARGVADEWDVDYVEIRSRRRVPGALPRSEHKVSVTIDLESDPDKLWTAFHTNHRRDIRRGMKQGFEVRFGGAELVEDFYTVLSESWRDLGTPIYSRAYFDAIVRAFPDRFRIAVVYASGEPAAAAFVGYSGTIVEGMWMGAKAQYRSKGVSYVLYWELIRDACLAGFRRFHLGRSTADSGGETFKKKWNAYIDQLYWVYLLRTRQDIPQLNVTNPKYRLAIRLWQRMPVSLTQVVGPLIARSIP